jgi:hypothetical protein
MPHRPNIGAPALGMPDLVDREPFVLERPNDDDRRTRAILRQVSSDHELDRGRRY